MNFLFVHSAVDDAGLDAEAFRVLAHIARRAGSSGTAFQSVKAAAKACCLNKDTVSNRLRLLEDLGWIIRVKRPGLPSGFRISESQPIRREGVSDAKGYPSIQVQPIRREGSDLSDRRGPKDIHEGTPIRRGAAKPMSDPIPVLPEPLASSPNFVAAWADWNVHRKQIRKPLTPLSAKQQLADLNAVGATDAVRFIQRAISAGWQGLTMDRSLEPIGRPVSGQALQPKPARVPDNAKYESDES